MADEMRRPGRVEDPDAWVSVTLLVELNLSVHL